MKLSIICPALICRIGMTPILQDVRRQAMEAGGVEVLALLDSGSMSTGEKLNALHGMAAGDYVAAIADDDDVAENYVSALLSAIGDGTDAVTFNVEVDFDNRKLPGYLNNVTTRDTNVPGAVVGPLSHCQVSGSLKTFSCGLHPLCAVRATVLKEFRYKPLSVGEDTAMSGWLTQRVSADRVRHVSRVLYRQHYRHSKQEFGGRTYRENTRAAV